MGENREFYYIGYLLCRCIVVTQRTEKGGQQTKNDGTLQYRRKKAGLTALSHFAIACRFNMLKQNKPICSIETAYRLCVCASGSEYSIQNNTYSIICVLIVAFAWRIVKFAP